MTKSATVTVDLPSGIAEDIELAVRSGDYQSASDVVKDALRLWQSSRDNAGFSDDEIGALWDAGIAGGPGRFSTVNELLAEAERRAKPAV